MINKGIEACEAAVGETLSFVAKYRGELRLAKLGVELAEEGLRVAEANYKAAQEQLISAYADAGRVGFT